MATVIHTRYLVRAAALALAIALLAVSSGCTNPFKPGTPEAPSGQMPVENFTTPEKLLTTIESAISAEGDGAQAYGDALADSTTGDTPFGFYAVADPGVLINWRAGSLGREPFDPGDIRHERLFYSNYLITVLESFDYAFVWDTDTHSPNDDIGADTALLHRRYLLQATSLDGSIEKLIAVGYADLTLKKHNGRWWLARWEDRVDPTIGITPADLFNRTMGWRRLDS